MVVVRLLQTGANDPVSGFAQRSHGGFRRLRRLSLAVAVIDQNGLATRGVAGIDVAPAISHEVAPREINIVLALGLQQESGLGLAASAMVRIIMIADEDGVDRQRSREPLMDGFDGLTRLRAARNIRLVGNDEESESVCLQVDQ